MVCVLRRHFLLVIAALAAGSLDAAAQQSRKLPRVGYLALNNEATGGHILIAFRQTMQELGWVDGQNINIETRFADGEVGRLPPLVDDLIPQGRCDRGGVVSNDSCCQICDDHDTDRHACKCGCGG